MSAPEDDIPLSVALARLAIEIESMKNMSAQLDGVIGPSSSKFNLDDPKTLEALQGLDRLTQELTSLKPFLDRLVEVAEMTENPDASSAVKSVGLGSLRARLSSVEVPNLPEPGEPDYF